MSRPRQKRFIGDAYEPESFEYYLPRHLEDMRVKNLSEHTAKTRGEYIRWFMAWCDARGLTKPRDITKPILERYQRHLYYHRKADGAPLSFRSQHIRLSALRVFFRWLAQRNYILYNPASDLELPKSEKRLPRHILSASEAEKVLQLPKLDEPLGLRDRAILETFYSTGMRRRELINLTPYDLDRERGTVMIRQGKGKKDRMIPMGERALAWVQTYIDEVRPQLTLEPDCGNLFLTQDGAAISPEQLSSRVRHYIDQADLGKSGACHVFRHTMATLMLENGADIRFIQAMLGHAELTATQVYTQVSIRKLKEIHTVTHPGAGLAPRNRLTSDTDDDTPSAEDVLAALEAEQDADEE
jgi:integrase/recombinase XerD